MDDIIQDFKKKLRVFDKYHFEEEPHIYWWLDKDGNRKQATTSMTALIHSYSQPFDSELVAERVAIKNKKNYDYASAQLKWYGDSLSAETRAELQEMLKQPITTQEVLDEWAFENNFSKVKGTHIHAFNEYMWQNLQYNYPKDEIIKQFGRDVLEEVWPKLTNIAKQFYDKFKDNIIPVGLELVIGDEELEICGSIDFLAYSKKLNSLIIIDYKSNKEIKFKSYVDKDGNSQKMQGCLSHLDDCNYVHYSLQLNGYQYILEKNTGLKLNNRHFLIWMNENNSSYEIYQTLDLYKEAQDMLYEHKVQNDCPF